MEGWSAIGLLSQGMTPGPPVVEAKQVGTSATVSIPGASAQARIHSPSGSGGGDRGLFASRRSRSLRPLSGWL
jgi:hypothetical protein